MSRRFADQYSIYVTLRWQFYLLNLLKLRIIIIVHIEAKRRGLYLNWFSCYFPLFLSVIWWLHSIWLTDNLGSQFCLHPYLQYIIHCVHMHADRGKRDIYIIYIFTCNQCYVLLHVHWTYGTVFTASGALWVNNNCYNAYEYIMKFGINDNELSPHFF